MIPKTLVILGIGAVVAALAPLAHGQSSTPTKLSNSDDDSVTLSGESLRTVEGRRLSGSDYQYFSPEASQVTGDVEAVNDNSQPSFRINEDLNLELVVGDTLNSREALDLFPNAGEPGDPERVKVQVELGQ
ncbi:hypothetical protein [Lyngbya aestuarii]|uniref:hypothetical protein n=1 Tax=Lyngbya aestuarii TaxID=118322 RepID=UPI00403D8E38